MGTLTFESFWRLFNHVCKRGFFTQPLRGCAEQAFLLSLGWERTRAPDTRVYSNAPQLISRTGAKIQPQAQYPLRFPWGQTWGAGSAYSSDLPSCEQPPARRSAEPGATLTTPGVWYSQLIGSLILTAHPESGPQGPQTHRAVSASGGKLRKGGRDWNLQSDMWSWEHGGFSHKYSLRSKLGGTWKFTEGSSTIMPWGQTQTTCLITSRTGNSEKGSLQKQPAPSSGASRQDAGRASGRRHRALLPQRRPRLPPRLEPTGEQGPPLHVPACPVPDATGEWGTVVTIFRGWDRSPRRLILLHVPAPPPRPKTHTPGAPCCPGLGSTIKIMALFTRRDCPPAHTALQKEKQVELRKQTVSGGGRVTMTVAWDHLHLARLDLWPLWPQAPRERQCTRPGTSPRCDSPQQQRFLHA